jgi:hypothetical protein
LRASGVQLWKLSSGGDQSLGPACDERGVFIGRTPLLERDERGYRLRGAEDLGRLLRHVYGDGVALDRVLPGLRIVAAALGERNLALAQIAAVRARLPNLPDFAARDRLEAEDRLIESERGGDRLARSAWDPAAHPRAGVPPNPGWFAPTSSVESPGQIAQGEEEERAPEEMLDPTAPLRQAQWDAAIATLRRIDPDNPQLASVTAPGWVPSNRDIAGLHAEIGRVVTRRVTNFVMPGGHPIGTAGGNVDVRVLTGGTQSARKAFDYLAAGGTPFESDYPGTLIKLPADAGFVGIRTNSQGIPTVDVNCLPGSV